MVTKSINGRYEARDRIGRGGMADVYKGVDCILKRDVAIKLLHDESASDPGFVERFRREAQAVARLNHPNIVSVYDWGAVDRSYYMVMEYVDGTNLKETIKERAPLEEAEALRIAADVAAALAVAHQGGIIHRDIKPQNILLTGNKTVKVVDFGIARSENLTQLTLTNAVYGTAHYFSPEQAQGRPVDARSDLYSLGVVLYEMLTGREPFQGSSLIEVAVQHVQQPPVPPRVHVPTISIAANDLVLRALAKHPDDRFDSASAMRAALLAAIVAPNLDAGARTQHVPIAVASDPAPAASRTARGPLPAPVPAQRQRERSPWERALFVIPVLFVALAALLAFHTLESPKHVASKPPASGPKKIAKAVATQPSARSHKLVATRTRATPRTSSISSHPSTVRPRTTAVPPTAVIVTVPAAPTSLPRARVIAGSSRPQPTATSTTSSAASQTSSSPSGPTGAVEAFYQAASAHDYSRAQSLWTSHMIQTFPPDTNLVGHFNAYQSVAVVSDKVLSYDPAGGTASVAVDLQQQRVGSSSAETLRGTWYLVKTPQGWKLDSPQF